MHDTRIWFFIEIVKLPFRAFRALARAFKSARKQRKKE